MRTLLHLKAVCFASSVSGVRALPYFRLGQTRSFGDVGSMSGLPESGHGWALHAYTPSA
jgi:hypothetical protein